VQGKGKPVQGHQARSVARRKLLKPLAYLNAQFRCLVARCDDRMLNVMPRLSIRSSRAFRFGGAMRAADNPDGADNE